MIQELRAAKELLEEKVNRNCDNSSMAPSTDLKKPAKKKEREKGEPRKKRGGQPGHPGHSRYLYPVQECQKVTDYYPQTCRCCGESLTGSDPNPYRHQVVEIPPIQLHIEEHRLHQLICSDCGQKTRATLPETVEASGYGSRVVAIVAHLSGMYRHSHRMVVSAMSDLFRVRISVGSVNRLRTEASDSVSIPVAQAQEYVQQQPIVGADETGFSQGNADGNNGLKKRAWLWVAVTPLVSFFCVMLSRSTEAAVELLGKNFRGILNCDRYSAYNWLDVWQRQLCWAHKKLEFTKISERSGVSGQLGKTLLDQQKKLFRLWHRVRDGTLTRSDFIEAVLPIREKVKATERGGSQLSHWLKGENSSG